MVVTAKLEGKKNNKKQTQHQSFQNYYYLGHFQHQIEVILIIAKAL